jgi:hypothetical protein
VLPSLAASRKNARMTACTSNLRQIGQGLRMYEQDWGELPQEDPIPFRDNVLQSYGVTKAIHHCPDGDPTLATDYHFRLSIFLFPPGLPVTGKPYAPGELEPYHWRIRQQPNSVLAYCPNHVKPYWMAPDRKGTFLALRGNGALQRVPAERAAIWRYDRNRWNAPNPPHDERAPGSLYHVFPDEPWPPELEEKDAHTG